ncbi:MAG: potassium-transporting ATPase subunit KdpC [Armatimonadetes bacterium]|nr:potassium-transporting ATPase subunit KdpC [Armatimonadota bacterium]MBS1711067.1 potassium-transporting ATPase subunit KdpC [Armatimonadota bacterium]MBX3108739.1 potassium-transporting ATPase subunit KdpC [Fimbriimonadaceae bacterium]
MKEVIVAIRVFVVLTVLTGVVYPLVITGVAQAMFPQQANGSLIRQDGRVVGSSLIGRQFDDPKYFWGRPSATSPDPYNGTASSGSNLGPTNPDLMKAIQGRVDALRAADSGNDQPIPTDLVTASGSGLDPHVSVAAAEYQIPRIARSRGMKETDVRTLVSKNTHGSDFGVFGERVVNVQELNLDLDRAKAR